MIVWSYASIGQAMKRGAMKGAIKRLKAKRKGVRDA